MDQGYLIIAIVAAIACVGVGWLMWREDFSGLRSGWYHGKELKRRAPLSAQQFHRLYYANSGIPLGLVERFRDFMGKCWGVDATRLIPEDDFVRMYDVDVVDFVADIRDEFGMQIPDEELGALDTSFDGLLRRIHAATPPVTQPHSPPSGGACVPTRSVGTRT